MDALISLCRRLASLLLLGLAGTAVAQSPGIDNQPAPAWTVDAWINLPDGATSLDVTDLKGKVVYLYCFQSWCPGCHRHGFPTLQKLIKAFEGDDSVAFVAVQTTFEGFQTNTADRAWETARRYDLTIPVGHSGINGTRSQLMSDYRTGGTPWTVIIDPDGVVRYNGFHPKLEDATELIRSLKTEPDAEVETLPISRGGQDRVGVELPELNFDGMLSTLPDSRDIEDADRPKATLYRWWTDSCPFCRSSLPALSALREKYADDGLEVVAVYHPKPRRRVKDDVVLRHARRLKFEGPVALDFDWSELDRAYHMTSARRATSISLLVDAKGVIRWVHPGPDLFPSDAARQARQNQDFESLEAAIRVLLNEPDERVTDSVSPRP